MQALFAKKIETVRLFEEKQGITDEQVLHTAARNPLQ
jgi:hypothetical protein